MSNPEGRYVPPQVGSPAENMAIDQALLESVDAGSGPVLRFYTWSDPTLSLGYFQKIGDRDSHAESKRLVCVRCATGGGAIVHHRELTYSVAIPIAGFTAGPRMDLYRHTHLAVIKVLSEFGVRASPFRMRSQSERSAFSAQSFLCFQRRAEEDLILSGYKVLGSAQRKKRRAVIQHGSLLLRTSEWAPQLPGVFDLTSRSIPLAELAERFTATLGELLAIRWTAGEISPAELRRASEIESEKFAAERWLRRR